VRSPNIQPPIADQERTPLVNKLVAQIDALLEALQRANSEIGQLRDEIAVLKGEKVRPRVQAQQDGRKHRQDGCAKL
jgi:hypothetical protein